MTEATISGICERVIYHNEENGYTIFKINTDQGITITCTGSSPLIKEKQNLRITGTWNNNPKYGKQLDSSIIIPIIPKDKHSMLQYLSSGVIPGIGEGFAKKLIDFAGTQLFEVLDKDPASLYEIKGVGKKRIETLLSHWQMHRASHEVLMFLQGFGIGPKRANKIFQTYQMDTMSVLQSDPYRLSQDIHGIGFKLADQIACKTGIAQDAPCRILACIHFILDSASQQGHCYLPFADVPKKVEQHIEVVISTPELEAIIKDDNLFVHEQQKLYLKKIYQAEQELIQSIQRLNQGENAWPLSIQRYSLSDLSCSGHQLSQSQQSAIQNTLSQKIGIITGGPGVGKTTITQAILQLAKEAKLRILLCAPTGRAAKKLSSCTNHSAKTIHRLLKIDPATKKFKHNANSPLQADIILIDECSMIDVFLARSLFAAIPDYANVVLVGDIDQLPSVGPGAFLNDMIQLNPDKTAYLTEIYRQGQDSMIIQNAHRINQGKTLLPNQLDQLSDFYFISETCPDTLHQRIHTLVTQRIPKRFSLNPMSDVQILSPMHKGDLGTGKLNELLQDILNPQHNKTSFKFRVGDKIIQTRNNYDKDVFNGDIGFVVEIDSNRKEVTINFNDSYVCYLFSELDEIQLAYAISIHKSQGSEYPAVIIPLAMQHFTLLERNLIYTAVTRGKKLVIIIGDLKALNMAIRNKKSHKRNTTKFSL